MQQYNPQIHHRQSIRLKNYDYAQAGLYFITLCCQHRAMLFGDVVNGSMVLNAAGQIADNCWLEIPQHFPNVVLHDYVIMPNHVHGILELTHQPNPPALQAHQPGCNDGVDAPSTSDNPDGPVGAENNSSDISVEPVGANEYSSDNSGKPVGANKIRPIIPVNRLGRIIIRPIFPVNRLGRIIIRPIFPSNRLGLINIRPIIPVNRLGRMVIRPYGHRQKPWGRLYAVIKLALQNGCAKIPLYMMYGNVTIMKISSGIGLLTNALPNISGITRPNGPVIGFMKNEMRRACLRYLSDAARQQQVFEGFLAQPWVGPLVQIAELQLPGFHSLPGHLLLAVSDTQRFGRWYQLQRKPLEYGVVVHGADAGRFGR